jgi:hypothetical protein
MSQHRVFYYDKDIINYVNAKMYQICRNGTVSWSPSLFLPEFRPGTHNNKFDVPRTRNKVKSWHKRWKTLIGAIHIG